LAYSAILITAYLIGFIQISLQVENPPSQQPTVQAILFYSPNCPHCHQVINEFLVPFQQTYGDQLQVIGIDTSHPVGNEIYGKAITWLEIPQTRQGVPTLIVGEITLVGGDEIPSLFPGLVEEGLASGGIGWPDIPDLAVDMPDLPPSSDPTSEPEVVTPTAAKPLLSSQDPDPVPEPTIVGLGEKISEESANETVEAAELLPETSQPIGGLENVNTEAMLSESDIPPADPVGFALAAFVLLGMVAALVHTIWRIAGQLHYSTAFPFSTDGLPWTVPALSFLGLGISLYLSYIEVAQVKAICGPVGECNIVQASEYAQLIGIPIAILGALSYIAVVVLWAGQRFLPARWSAISFTGLVALTIFATVFSIYLTLIELFAIRAVCAWCLTSATISTLLMLLVVACLSKQPSETRLEVQSYQS